MGNLAMLKIARRNSRPLSALRPKHHVEAIGVRRVRPRHRRGTQRLLEATRGKYQAALQHLLRRECVCTVRRPSRSCQNLLQSRERLLLPQPEPQGDCRLPKSPEARESGRLRRPALARRARAGAGIAATRALRRAGSASATSCWTCRRRRNPKKRGSSATTGLTYLTNLEIIQMRLATISAAAASGPEDRR